VELEARVEGAGPELATALEALPGVQEVKLQNGRLFLRADSDVRAEVARLVVEQGAKLLELRRRGLTLEEIYLRYFQG
jgi:hypothetical protein